MQPSWEALPHPSDGRGLLRSAAASEYMGVMDCQEALTLDLQANQGIGIATAGPMCVDAGKVSVCESVVRW